MRIIGFNITFELDRNNQFMVASIGQMFGIVSRGFGFIINVYLKKIQASVLILMIL